MHALWPVVLHMVCTTWYDTSSSTGKESAKENGYRNMASLGLDIFDSKKFFKCSGCSGYPSRRRISITAVSPPPDQNKRGADVARRNKHIGRVYRVQRCANKLLIPTG